MEDQNHTVNDSLTLSTTQNESPPTETKAHTNTNTTTTATDNNNNSVVNAVGVDYALTVTVPKSETENSGQAVKRGRGRPRKYDVNGNMMSPVSAPSGFPDHAIESTVKRSRGRPRGSGKLQILAAIGGYIAETAGGSFTPHVLTVSTGEDVVSKIISFFQRGPRAACILSATGVVSSVIIRQSCVSGGFLRYEGLFEILSLSGSFTHTSGASGAHRTNGTLSVLLAKPDGRVFGGCIESSLIAAGPIQLVMATFKQNISNQIKKRLLPESSNAPNMPDIPDLERDPPKVQKLMEGVQSSPSPKSEHGPTETTNDIVENVNSATTNEVADNVIPADDNMHSASVNGVDLECHIHQPITDKGTSADTDASVTKM
ncbi:AT-hook motif nuclear-localized protein 7-like [Abrus precatorius]|uniref:AT-hook motif nuclear-localized protein n=1 Tax=Abrus precatorius TaxID=3816 RepID=A0A8B8KWB2_ABRPR|nr:AT-hook motif nuclear-localized protein 7-like [Abrus precatorius]